LRLQDGVALLDVSSSLASIMRTHSLLFPHGNLLFPLLHTPLPGLDVDLVDISAWDLAVGAVVVWHEAVQLGLLVSGGATPDIGFY
jgi:hypothetical protein